MGYGQTASIIGPLLLFCCHGGIQRRFALGPGLLVDCIEFSRRGWQISQNPYCFSGLCITRSEHVCCCWFSWGSTEHTHFLSPLDREHLLLEGF